MFFVRSTLNSLRYVVIIKKNNSYIGAAHLRRLIRVDVVNNGTRRVNEHE